jgi:hypothetical protein
MGQAHSLEPLVFSSVGARAGNSNFSESNLFFLAFGVREQHGKSAGSKKMHH